MADWGKGLGGAATGALSGFATGGPWGAAAGGIGGGLAGLFGGGSDKRKISDNLDPIQRRHYEQQSQALQGQGGPLADVYGQFNPELMRDYYEKNYAQPQYQEFQENVVPTITGQFRGNNLQNSSYLGGALGKAGTNVQNNLNAQMAGMLYKGQQSSLDRRSNALNNIMNTNTQIHEGPTSSIFDDLLGNISSHSGDMIKQIMQNRKQKSSSDWQGADNMSNEMSGLENSVRQTQAIGG